MVIIKAEKIERWTITLLPTVCVCVSVSDWSPDVYVHALNGSAEP